MRCIALISVILSGSIAGVSAQPATVLNLPDRLYFHAFFSSGRIFYVQESSTPIEVFSTKDRIFDYSWSPDSNRIVLVTNAGQTIGPDLYTNDFQFVRELDVELYKNDSTHYPMAWSLDSNTLFIISPSDTDAPMIVTLPLELPDQQKTAAIPLRGPEELVQVYWSTDVHYLLYQTLSFRPLLPRLTRRLGSGSFQSTICTCLI